MQILLIFSIDLAGLQERQEIAEKDLKGDQIIKAAMRE
jgi:hypothetical protein